MARRLRQLGKGQAADGTLGLPFLFHFFARIREVPNQGVSATENSATTHSLDSQPAVGQTDQLPGLSLFRQPGSGVVGLVAQR